MIKSSNQMLFLVSVSCFLILSQIGENVAWELHQEWDVFRDASGGSHSESHPVSELLYFLGFADKMKCDRFMLVSVLLLSHNYQEYFDRNYELVSSFNINCNI